MNPISRVSQIPDPMLLTHLAGRSFSFSRFQGRSLFFIGLLVVGFLAFPRLAQAQYAEQTGSDNPFDGLSATSTPAAVDALAGDFDTDGDVDLLAYDGSSELFFANDGSGTFSATTGSGNPFNGIAQTFGTRGRTFLRDVDSDGDLDVVPFDYTGSGTGTLGFVENTDGSTYARRTGTDNPFDGIAVSGNQSTVDAIMGDFDNDGDPDLLAYDGSSTHYYQNDTSGSGASFSETTGGANPFDGISQPFWTNTTTLVRDFDGDNVVELASRDGTGDATNWTYLDDTDTGYAVQSDDSHPLSDVAADATAKSVALVTGDFDLDGALDLITYHDGTQRYYDGDGAGSFVEETGSSTPFDGGAAVPALRVGANTFSQDMDGDADPDLTFSDVEADANGLRFVQRTNATLALTDGSSSGVDFTAEVSPGTSNNAIGVLRLSAGQTGATINEITVTNQAPGVAGISAARLFWSKDLDLDVGTDTELDAQTTDADSAPASITFTGFHQSVPPTAHALIVAIDVETGASASGVRFELAQPEDLSILGAQVGSVNGNDKTNFSGLPLSNGSTDLPVEMASFEGTTTKAGVQLQWQTASEAENVGFRVQRRERKVEAWTDLGFVDGRGTTSKPQHYRFTDQEVPYAIDSVRYRLEQVDTDGTTSYTAPVVVAREGPKQVRLVGTYPNPVRERAIIRYAVPQKWATAVTLQLFDVMGRRVRTVAGEAEGGRHELVMDVDGLSSGVYVLRLRAGHEVKTRKMTVMR